MGSIRADGRGGEGRKAGGQGGGLHPSEAQWWHGDGGSKKGADSGCVLNLSELNLHVDCM